MLPYGYSYSVVSAAVIASGVDDGTSGMIVSILRRKKADKNKLNYPNHCSSNIHHMDNPLLLPLQQQFDLIYYNSSGVIYLLLLFFNNDADLIIFYSNVVFYSRCLYHRR